MNVSGETFSTTVRISGSALSLAPAASSQTVILRIRADFGEATTGMPG